MRYTIAHSLLKMKYIALIVRLQRDSEYWSYIMIYGGNFLQCILITLHCFKIIEIDIFRWGYKMLKCCAYHLSFIYRNAQNIHLFMINNWWKCVLNCGIPFYIKKTFTYFFQCINSVYHITAAQKNSCMFTLIGGNSWMEMFSSIMRFITELNFGTLCSIYTNLQII